jgi:hypothetical protein
MDSEPPFLPDYLSSSPESEVLELSKEALDTASVFPNQVWCFYFELTPLSRLGFTFIQHLTSKITGSVT